MCALRAHIKLSIFENFFSRIEKAVNIFLIPEKFFFQKWELVCALGAHISKILNKKFKICIGKINTAMCLNLNRKFKVQSLT